MATTVSTRDKCTEIVPQLRQTARQICKDFRIPQQCCARQPACSFCGDNNVCRGCLKKANVTCGACKRQVKASTFNRYQLKRHFDSGHPLTCQACKEDGCTSRNQERYQCTKPSCRKLLGHKAFDRNQLNHYIKRHSSRLLCQSCRAEPTFTCTACKRRLIATVFNAKHLQAHDSDGKQLVCQACLKDGCTSKDPKRYRCRGLQCRKSFGRRAFDHKHHQHIHQNSRLLCQTCLPKLQSLKKRARQV